MHFSKEQIEHLSKLCLIELLPDEIERYTQELNAIIEYIEKLNKLDTSQVEPTYHVMPKGNVLREDKVIPSFSPQDLLNVVPAHEEGAIKVPKIIEGAS